MFEKVNPCHPDKVADRIAGAFVDLAYQREENPKIAVEVLIGHGYCHIIIESSVHFEDSDARSIVERIAGEKYAVDLNVVMQDKLLAKNQSTEIRCGDNGIFKGCPTTVEQNKLASIAQEIYYKYPTDGKYILAGDKLIICQSCAKTSELEKVFPYAKINPLGEWTGGAYVDSGATNRKLGSDMGDAVTGGGLHGKDLSKADISVNIYAFLEAQRLGKNVEFLCAIGDSEINGIPYSEIVSIAKHFIAEIGGFEKFAEWGLIR